MKRVKYFRLGFCLFTLLLSFSLFCQPPQSFRYQAVVRDNNNKQMQNKVVSVKINILKSLVAGQQVYSETFEDTTNAKGLINLDIGRGTPLSAKFTDIDWKTGEYFLEISVDIKEGNGYKLIGKSQLLSVPYAINAGNLILQSGDGQLWEMKVAPDGFVSTGCPPEPTKANAGYDYKACYASPVTLNANTPVYGTGKWSIVKGGGGTIADTSNPQSKFTGLPDSTYTLRWSISTVCRTSSDDVIIAYHSNPKNVSAGPDQIDIESDSTNIAGNIPFYGTGLWTVTSGYGGTFNTTSSPTTIFKGIKGNSYVLRWTIKNECGNKYDEVNISFKAIPGEFTCSNNFTDSRDGKSYKTIPIGTQCWMAENINFGKFIAKQTKQSDNGVIEKYCYNDDENNCITYGGLYQWGEAMQYVTTEKAQGICMQGWHIPSDAEWTALTDVLGGLSVAGGKMKETGTAHWSSPNTGATNESGFTALPAGELSYSGSFKSINSINVLWSSTTFITTNAMFRDLFSTSVIVKSDFESFSSGFSIRCVKDQ